MTTPCLLMAFDNLEHFQRDAAKLVDASKAFVEGEHELWVGDACELVLVHPDSGDSFQLDGKVIERKEDGIVVQAQATTLVRNQLRKFAGLRESANIHERLRKLKMGEVVRLAHTGELEDRVALERMYGKSVWEALLNNPKLTVGEVLRLARNGTMTRPLLERILTNSAWVRVPQIRRALLTHRRLDGGMIMRVLNLTPPAELKLIAKQTAYPAPVRVAANKMMGR